MKLSAYIKNLKKISHKWLNSTSGSSRMKCSKLTQEEYMTGNNQTEGLNQ